MFLRKLYKKLQIQNRIHSNARDISLCALHLLMLESAVASADVRDAYYCAPAFAFMGDTNTIKSEDNAEIASECSHQRLSKSFCKHQ